MVLWGKIIGGIAGFAVGGPMGAVAGAALGHAADSGEFQQIGARLGRALPFDAARLAGLLGRHDQVFAIGITVLAAKLAKCDGPVNRAEIDAFKRQFQIEDAALPTVGRMFDQAREDSGGYESFARQLAESFADNQVLLEQVLAALHVIARADEPVNRLESDMLTRIAYIFKLDNGARARASSNAARFSSMDENAYDVLGVSRDASNEELRARWKQLMRENHPDQLSARGVPEEFVRRATERVARVNAAYDRIKRERGL
jgi:DnaJ like chaperone protein